MESEKIKELKEFIERSAFLGQWYKLANSEVTMMEVFDYINELESENETLRNAKVVYENVDYCYEDLKKAEKKIAELEKENEILQGTKDRLTFANRIELVDNAVETKLKQLYDKLKEKFYYEGRICRYIIDSDVFDQTLKEFLDD
jgi:rubrerythrin